MLGCDPSAICPNLASVPECANPTPNGLASERIGAHKPEPADGDDCQVFVILNLPEQEKERTFALGNTGIGGS